MAQNQAKVFLSELYNAPLVFKIAQYRRDMYRCAWNGAVLIGKTIYEKVPWSSETCSTTIPTLNLLGIKV
jgi:hypothetical protein